MGNLIVTNKFQLDIYVLLGDNILIDFFKVAAAPASSNVAPAISLTDKALNHMNKIRSERNEDLCLRIGVKQGGCSGMSYTMEFDNQANTGSDDSVIEYDGFTIGKVSFFFYVDFIYCTTSICLIIGN